VQHPEKVPGESLVAHDEPPKVLEPGEEPLDLPPASIATQLATVSSPLFPRSTVRRDQRHATASQVRIQSVRLIGVVADEMHRELIDKPLSKGGLY